MTDQGQIFNLILYGIYYLILLVVIFLGLFGVYLLITHGRNRLVSLSISAVYLIIFTFLFTLSQVALYSLSY